MIQIAHLEDNAQYSDKVRTALGDSVNLTVLTNLRDFLIYPLNGTQLLIADRHLPAHSGARPDDKSWRGALEFLGRHYSEVPVFILSSHPPKPGEVLKYGINLAGTMAKSDFDRDSDSFKYMINGCLGGII